MNLNLLILVAITLFFFSTSSVLARAALINNSIDPYSFTFLRLFFGSVTLLIILYFKEKKLDLNIKTNWNSSFMLFSYAICFSLAYINLDAGLGALILFAIVQLTTIVVGLFKKEQLTIKKSFGILIAIIGLIYLLLPDKETNISLFHAFLMVLSGIAWGFYTILGKSSKNAILHTTDNFVKSLFFITILTIPFILNLHISSFGVLMAFISGGITSAIGYALWYYLLPNMKIITSGILQLLIPPLAIFLGVIFLNEEFTFKLALSTLIILSGIFIYMKSKEA